VVHPRLASTLTGKVLPIRKAVTENAISGRLRR
jgi:hypothetical protein